MGLFSRCFKQRFIYLFIYSLPSSTPFKALLSQGLWCAGIGHLHRATLSLSLGTTNYSIALKDRHALLNSVVSFSLHCCTTLLVAIFNKQSPSSLLWQLRKVALTKSLLIPKLRSHFAEFLQHNYLKRLSLLNLFTCVGLGYGYIFKSYF